jgi:carbon-monoxide dehydrogenase medium subunit
MLRPFRILEPTTVEEASALLAEYGDDAAFYAGGTELLVVMKEGLAHFPHLVNIKTIPGLDRIESHQEGRVLRLGALATHRRIERSPVVRERAPVLAAMEEQVANVRVRHAGTIGGNLCFAEPHSDPATLLVCWHATFELASTRGTRRVPARDFFLGLLETAREPDELMTAIDVPLPPQGVGLAYERFSTHERPTANVAVQVEWDEGRIGGAWIVVGSVGPRPQAMVAAGRLLRDEAPSEHLFRAAGDAVAREVELIDDPLESADYKRQIVRTLVARALATSVRRIEGAARAA